MKSLGASSGGWASGQRRARGLVRWAQRRARDPASGAASGKRSRRGVGRVGRSVRREVLGIGEASGGGSVGPEQRRAGGGSVIVGRSGVGRGSRRGVGRSSVGCQGASGAACVRRRGASGALAGGGS